MFHRDDKKIGGDRHFSRGAVLDNLEALVVAIILALVLRCFLVEAFAIPSGSMGSTLLGDHRELKCTQCDYKFAADRDNTVGDRCPNCGSLVPAEASRVWGGDRILVNKVLYRFEKPHRWDPFVFINPAVKRGEVEKSTFIKRLIGLPTEKLEIIRGDIVVNGEIQRKTPTAQRSLWMLVYDSGWPWKEKDPWVADTGVWTQTAGKGLLSVDARNSIRPESVRFAGHEGDTIIKDHYGYNTGTGTNVVTDVKVTLDVMPQSAGSLIIGLPEDAMELRCVLPVEGSAERGMVALREVPLKDVDVKLPLGKVTRVEFSRVDYLITLKVGGKEFCHVDMWDAGVYANLARQGQSGALRRHETSGVRLAAVSLKAEFPWIRIDRDVYYGSGYNASGTAASIIDDGMGGGWRTVNGGPFGPGTFDLPEYIGPINLGPDQYVALGDNSPRSSDSRYWGPVPEKNLVGKALLVWWWPTRARFIH